MPDFTPFAALIVPTDNESAEIDGGAVYRENPRVIDGYLKIGAWTHRHDAHDPIADPTLALTGSVETSGGGLQGDLTFYAGYTVIDGYGGETALSPVLGLGTGSGLGAPASALVASVAYASGIVMAGDHYYAATYTNGEGGETPLGPPVAVYVDPGYASAQVSLSGLSTGAPAGWAATRLWHSYQGSDWHLVAEQTADSYVDDGFNPPDNPAQPPDVDSTGDSYALSITLPASIDGDSLNLYLSTDSTLPNPALYGSYPASSAGSTITVVQYTVSDGEPPASSRASRGAAKINPDTDMVDFPWKRPAASFGALPSAGNVDDDIRVVVDEARLYQWIASASVWNPLQSTGGGGGGGGGGSAALAVGGAIGSSITDVTELTLFDSLAVDLGGGHVGIVGGAVLATTVVVGADHTLAIADAGSVIEIDGFDLHIPLNSVVPMPVGAVIEVFQLGTRQVQVIVDDPGITLVTPSNDGLIQTAGQGATIGLRQRDFDIWVLTGDRG